MELKVSDNRLVHTGTGKQFGQKLLPSLKRLGTSSSKPEVLPHCSVVWAYGTFDFADHPL